jgi:hypothetical protein
MLALEADRKAGRPVTVAERAAHRDERRHRLRQILFNVIGTPPAHGEGSVDPLGIDAKRDVATIDVGTPAWASPPRTGGAV